MTVLKNIMQNNKAKNIDVNDRTLDIDVYKKCNFDKAFNLWIVKEMKYAIFINIQRHI